MLNMNDFENNNVNEIEEKNYKSRQLGWRIFAFSALLLAIIALFGAWYINNERMFLLIDNSKLKLEVKTLQEEIATLKTLGNDSIPNNTEGNSRPTDSNPAANQQTDNTYTMYEVKPGDSLTTISLSFYGTEIYASQIAEQNGITPESILQLGQKLKIPKKP